MDFALLPPETNSGRMYVGAGSGPMLAAAAVWDEVATELHSAATSYESVISEVNAGLWLGAAATAMTAAARPYVAWMRSTATRAEQTAIQAKAAAAAYEVTFAAMAPPPVIAANRALLHALVATNLFGQNTPAIAATETLYAEMWAQDATAMYGYAGASASATKLTMFTPSPQTTTGAPAVALQGFTSTAATDAASGSVLDTLSSLEGNALFLPNVAQAGLTPLTTAGLFVDLQYDDSEIQDQAQSQRTEDNIVFRLTHPNTALPAQPEIPAPPSVQPRVETPAAAGLGQASVVGRLSVPPAWTVAAPEIRLAAMTLPATSLGAAPEVFAANPGSVFSEMALANMASRAMSGARTPGRQERIASSSRARPGPTPKAPSGHMTVIADDIREFAELLVKLGDLRDAGLLTDEEFNEQKERLLAR
jgi:PPE-repeat protein